MNKKLLTLAIGAALASAPMFANAAATVYGEAHLSIDSLTVDNTTDDTLRTLSSNSSFIGIKAEEDLGGGMKAIAGVEWQVALDAAATGIANRNVFVGLQGGFGTVRFGNYDDVVKQVGRAVDMFHSTQIGESRSLTRQNAALHDMDARLANSINYESPSLGGVTITGNYGFANDADASSGQDTTAMAIGAQFKSGGLYVGAAYKSVDRDIGTTTDTATGARVAASFEFGFGLKLAGFYQTMDDAAFFNYATQTMGLGVSFKVGNGVIKGQYYTVDESGSGFNDGATLTAIGYDHNLSKNTMVYAVYGKVENDPNGGYTIIGAGHANPLDADFNNGGGGTESALSLGMKMKF